MSRKTQSEFVDRTLGFPVTLRDVPMRKVRGEWVPDYDPNAFQRRVLKVLVFSPTPLTGNHLRFIRLWLEETQEVFGSELGVTHAAVSQWESKGDQPTGMGKSVEVHVRLRVLMELTDTTDSDALGRITAIDQDSSPDTPAIDADDLNDSVPASA